MWCEEYKCDLNFEFETMVLILPFGQKILGKFSIVPLMMPGGYETETICSGISFHIFLSAIAVIPDLDTRFQFNCYTSQCM